MIFNLFCDASIDINKKIACGGCYITGQEENLLYPINTKALIQLNATNNSSEILAIWIGVVEALNLRCLNPGAIFRLFSDSKISIYGLRSWMINWVRNTNSNNDKNTLISSSGQRVMNQQRFIDIYNMIVRNNLHIELYHQRGHVGERSVSMEKARADFIKANKVCPEALGIDIGYLSNCNDYIDNFTRDAIRVYNTSGQFVNGVSMELPDPMFHIIQRDKLNQYVHCIDKTTVVSRHDFKGGYNQ